MDALTIFLAFLSCTLIGAGVWLVLRDVRRAQAVATAEARVTHSDALASAGSHEPGLDFGSPPDMRAPTPATGIAPDPKVREAESLVRWQALQPVLASALRAVNGAFDQVDAYLTPHAPPEWDDVERWHAATIALTAAGRLTGHVQVALSATELEITAISVARGADSVTRLRRLAPDAINIHSLAEAIAACAWPILAVEGGIRRER